jgi:hypothetical protein
LADDSSIRAAPGYVERDVAFLGVIVLLSCAPYVAGLGLYGDDWTFFAEYERSSGTLRALFMAGLVDLNMDGRPIQALLLAVLFRLFGPVPLAFHAVNAAVLAGIVMLFHLVLRRLNFVRSVAVAVPLVFGLLPHYSTDRFWIAAFQANAAVLLYFVSLYADLRFVQRSDAANDAVAWSWKLLGAVALVASVLAYEVTAVLFLVNVVVLLRLSGAGGGGAWLRRAWPSALLVGTNVLLLGLAVGYKLMATQRAGVSGGLRFRLLRVFTEAAPVHFVEQGIALPLKAARALALAPSPAVLLVSLAIGIAASVWIWRLMPMDPVMDVTPISPPVPGGDGWPGSWLGFVVVGFALFCAGYGMTVFTWEIGFHATGANNRTAIGATLGTAWVFVGVIGWMAAGLRSVRLRALLFAGGIGLVAATGTLLTNAVASFWVHAAREQDAVVGALLRHVPAPAGRTVMLLDGVCPFHGPAPVFVTSWDVTGMLHRVYGDRSVRGDVLKPTSELLPDGVRTILFDDVINVYGYGERLIAFHVGTGVATVLRDRQTADDYMMGASAPARPQCAPYTDGDGADIY